MVREHGRGGCPGTPGGGLRPPWGPEPGPEAPPAAGPGPLPAGGPATPSDPFLEGEHEGASSAAPGDRRRPTAAGAAARRGCGSCPARRRSPGAAELALGLGEDVGDVVQMFCRERDARTSCRCGVEGLTGGPPAPPPCDWQTVSGRVLNKKTSKYASNIHKRGNVPTSLKESYSGPPIGPLVLAFLCVVVFGGEILNIVMQIF